MENDDQQDDAVLAVAGDPLVGVAERIKARIDVSWGRYLSCGDGWLALLGELDRDLAELFPDYRVYQCKEKFGALRYYTDAEEAREPQCCVEFMERDPMPSDSSWLEDPSSNLETALVDHEAWDAWEARFGAHVESDEHRERDLELREKIERARVLIRGAEERSARTCEVCGEAGVLARKNGWYRVRCGEHTGTSAS